MGSRSGLYVQLDTNFPDDEKVEAVGLGGAGLYAMSLCIAKRLLTDGKLTRRRLYALGADDALIDKCVEVGLYVADDDSVWVAAWLDHNPSRSAIDATRMAKAEAARAGNHRRWNHPGEVADCAKCGASPQVSRISDRTRADGAKRVRSPETETETEPETETIPLLSQSDLRPADEPVAARATVNAAVTEARAHLSRSPSRAQAT